MDYYLWLDESQKGPYSLEQIKHMWLNGLITKNTKIWHDGLQDWTYCGMIENNLSCKDTDNKTNINTLLITANIKNKGMGLLLALLFPGLGGIYSGFVTFIFGVAAIIVFTVGFYQSDYEIYWPIAGVLQIASVISSVLEIEVFNENLLKEKN